MLSYRVKKIKVVQIRYYIKTKVQVDQSEASNLSVFAQRSKSQCLLMAIVIDHQSQWPFVAYRDSGLWQHNSAQCSVLFCTCLDDNALLTKKMHYAEL